MTPLRALVLIFSGVEEVEALTPVDLLRRAKVTVDLLAVGPQPTVMGRNGIRIVAEGIFPEDGEDAYDLVVVPGGPGHAALLDNTTLTQFLSHQAAQGGWIASICAGPLVLQKAGLLKGKSFTAFPGTAAGFSDPLLEQPVVIDGKLITSRGAGTAYPFALSLVEALCGREAAAHIAAETCYSG